MSSNKRKLKKGTKKRLLRRFMKIMLSTFVVGTIVVLAGIAGYQKISGDNNIFEKFPKLTAEEKEEKKVEKLKTNVAIFGVDDDGYRADTMLVAHFDGETNTADLISVPRDTMIKFTDREYERIQDVNSNTPRTIKLNEMTAYAGIDNVDDFTVPEIEKILGIAIDNYVTVEMDAFREIVDIVGGVEVDVPQRMYYNDNAQGLHIDLQPGLQELNGEEAEGLVRFRKGYPAGDDISRIGTQQIFLKAFAKQVLSPSNITRLPKIVQEVFKHITTDVNLLDVPKYYGHAKNFDVDSMGFHTIPGDTLYQNNLWYFIPDMNEMDEFIDDIFDKNKEEKEEDIIEEDKTVKLEILNGGASTGAAGKLKREIEEEGYNVSNVGNYTGEFEEETIIYARDILKARQFEEFCPDCKMTQDNLLDDSIDVRIVIGSNDI